MTNFPVAASAASCLVRITYNGQAVLTTGMLAVVYSVPEGQIRKNFQRNPERFRAGEHYFKLEGDDLRNFKRLHEGQKAFTARLKDVSSSGADPLKEGLSGGTEYLKDTLSGARSVLKTLRQT